MAQRVLTLLEDDIDGGEADETVTFALDGTSYEIDLNEKNAKALRDALSGFVSAARKVPGARVRSTASRPPAGRSSRSDLADIRAWAKDNGHEVSDRGRVPNAVIEAYDAAH